MRTAAAYALVVVLAIELAVWGCFLVQARPFGEPLPLAALLAFASNVALGLAGARVLRHRVGAVIPGVLWLVISLVAGTKTTEGDLIITNGTRGLLYLLLGAVGAALVIGVAGPRSVPAVPEAPPYP